MTDKAFIIALRSLLKENVPSTIKFYSTAHMPGDIYGFKIVKPQRLDRKRAYRPQPPTVLARIVYQGPDEPSPGLTVYVHRHSDTYDEWGPQASRRVTPHILDIVEPDLCKRILSIILEAHPNAFA